MRKVIVTGATGFIGRFLVRELTKQKVEVIAIVRKGSKRIDCLNGLGVRIVECDIGNYNSLPLVVRDRDVDVAFHVAWQGAAGAEARNQRTQLQNLRANLELIDVCYEMGVKTFVGCGSIYEAEGLVEMSQNKIVTNLGFMYKSAKIAAHWMGKAKCGSYGIKFFWPLINTYGEEEDSDRLINTVIKRIFAGESPALSAGTQYYDFVHVSDVAHALYLIADKGRDGTNYVIGSGNAKPLKEFLEVVCRITNEVNGGSHIGLGFGQVTNDVIYLPLDTFDITQLRIDTGFEAKVSFEEGVRRTVEWLKKRNCYHSAE